MKFIASTNLFSLRFLGRMILFIFLSISKVYASEYGCKVLLCLANPGNPKQYAECVPPITQLFRDLAKGRSFPTCGLADGHDGSSYAKQVYDPYDPCPTGTQPANPATYVVQGSNTVNRSRWQSAYNISGQPSISQPNSVDGQWIGSRACTANPTGQYIGGNGDISYPVYVYKQVIWQAPQSPHAIDVYIDNQFYQRVRW